MTTTTQGVRECISKVKQWFENEYQISYLDFPSEQAVSYMGWLYASKLCGYINFGGLNP